MRNKAAIVATAKAAIVATEGCDRRYGYAA
jgi:hypothetical protein